MNKITKKFIVFLSLILIITTLVSCNSAKGIFLNAMNSLKRGDVKQFCSYFDNESNEEANTIISLYSKLPDNRKQFYKDVILSNYSFVIKENEENKNYLNVELTYVDMDRLINDMAIQTSLSSIDDVLTNFSKDSVIEKYLKTDVITVVMENSENKLVLPFNRKNEELTNKLNLINSLRWLENV